MGKFVKSIPRQLDELHTLKGKLEQLAESVQQKQFDAMTESEQQICESLGEQKMQRYQELQQELELLAGDFAQRMEAAMSEETRAKIERIQNTTLKQANTLQTKIAGLEQSIKTGVKARGRTVAGTYLQCVFSRGRLSLIRDKFEAYAKQHPEANTLVKESAPSASIRTL